MLAARTTAFLLAFVAVQAQDPSASWTPTNHESIGMHCYSGAPNPNKPHVRGHMGGCGCENTLLRLDGQLYMMESAEHSCEEVFDGYNSTAEGDCSYFRIRNASSGMVIANVSQSLRHSFFAAVADHKRRQLWVFGSAHARSNKVKPNACDVKPTKGCYVGVVNASFDDLTKWSEMRPSLVLPDGHALFNNDVALVYGPNAPAAVPGLPKMQAVMIIEQRTDDPHKYPFISSFAVNTGTDGDYSRNWQTLDAKDADGSWRFDLHYPKGAAGEGTGDAPTLRFDAEEGYFYSIGGGWITNGPARSRNLSTWEVSPRAPMAVPDARAARAGLCKPGQCADETAGPNTQLYTSLWASGVPPNVAQWASNLSAWDWGVTDPDLCCSDGKAPSFLVNCLSRQGAPSDFHGKSYGFSRLRQSKLPLNEWLRSYFPAQGEAPQRDGRP